MPQRIVSDEQQRSLPEFARPKGSQKMDDFCVAPPQCTFSSTISSSRLEIISFFGF